MKRAAPRIALLLILFLAAALRWWQPGLVEFKYDEAHTVGLALDIASGGPFPLTSGGTSIGLERPAFDAYWLAIPLLLGRVEAAVWWVAAFGILSVALVYVLGMRMGGRHIGLLASLYMAANPWLVAYDRKLWSHIQVFLSVALLLLAWEIVVRGRKRAVAWFAVAAVLQCLAHLLALLQVLSWLPALALAPRTPARRRWVLHGGTAAFAGLPLVLGLGLAGGSAPHEHLRSMLASLIPMPGGFWPLKNLAQALALFGGSGINVLAASEPVGLHRVAAYLAWPVVGLILVGGVAFCRRAVASNAAGRAGRLLLAWTALPLLVLALAPTVFQQYWTVLLPLPALYFAFGVRLVLRRLPRLPGALIGVLALLGLLTLWTGTYANVQAAVDRGQGLSTFGVPLCRWEQAAQAAVRTAREVGAAGICISVDGVDPRYESEPAVAAALLHNREDARIVAPGRPYFALIDSRYESEGNVIATETLRSTGEGSVSVAPGYSLLDENRPTVFLWAAGDSGIEEEIGRVGMQVWEGELARGRSPARVYLLPSRSEVAYRAASAVALLTTADQTTTSAVVVNEPESLVKAALTDLPVTVIPPLAGDLLASEQAALELRRNNVMRVVFVEQPSGWWDASALAKRALQAIYRPVGEWPEQLWEVHVYSAPPGELTRLHVPFEGGPWLEAVALDAATTAPGGIVIIHALWSPSQGMEEGLKVSWQLLSIENRLVAQSDRELTGTDFGSGGTSYAIRLPLNAPSGQHRLIAVVYDGATGRRLRTPTSDSAEISPIRVLELASQ